MRHRPRPGDVIVVKEAGGYQALKVVAAGRSGARKAGACVVILYETVPVKPSLDQISELKVESWYMPLPELLADSGQYLGNLPVTSCELDAYLSYLKHHHFKRYLEETGQNLDEVIGEARSHFSIAQDLVSQRRFEQAIEQYTAAADLVPLYYEAIDNRAFVRMQMGDYRAAIEDFKQSLNINPLNFTALFSIGECYFKLAEFGSAGEYFQKAWELEPGNRRAREWLDRAAAAALHPDRWAQ